MPYDSRPQSEGGNRGIDERCSRKAPKGKFRVVGVDTSDGGDWLEGDFNTIGQARKRARAKGGEMTMMHVYNDKGQRVAKAGTL